jgi:hypothetical protein
MSIEARLQRLEKLRREKQGTDDLMGDPNEPDWYDEHGGPHWLDEDFDDERSGSTCLAGATEGRADSQATHHLGPDLGRR